MLIVDDDLGLRQSLSLLLEGEGIEVAAEGHPQRGLDRAAREEFDLVLCDVRMPEMSGIEFLRRYQEGGGGALVIMMSAYGGEDAALEAMKHGAYDYLPKPFRAEEVLLTLRKAAEREGLRRRVASLEAELARWRELDVVADSPLMRRVMELAGRVAPHGTTVLITGESGTGKEVVARAIHRMSPRRDGPFVAVNCGAIPEQLLESELFGHVKGAFTGADQRRVGRFEQADGGTLFLDEIGDMSPALQTRLLRVLAENEFFRVGGQQTIKVDVRVIAATHQDLARAVEAGRFREDLFHRLNVMHIEAPPLRARRDDVLELARFYLAQAASELSLVPKKLTTEAAQLFLNYDWPGNVRELVNLCRRLTVTAAGREITAYDLPTELGGAVPESTGGSEWTSGLARWAAGRLASDANRPLLDEARPAFERTLIEAAMRRSHGKRLQAAKLLGWGRNTLTRKLKELGLDERYESEGA